MASMESITKKGHLIPFLPLLLYIAALNPYFLPGTYDNIVFFYGAKSLLENGIFAIEGKYIVDWAPGLSILLAIPFALAGESVWLGKGLIILCVGAGIFFTSRYLKAEGNPNPRIICLLFALIPTGFMMGTRIMTEWPFIALSFLFLWQLKVVDGEKRSMGLGVLLGFILGAAALTRWIGVLLGFALIGQLVSRMKAGKITGFRCILPEFTAALIGGSVYCLWKLKLAWLVHSGLADSSMYYPDFWYIYIFETFKISTLPYKISDLFFQATSINRFLGVEANPVRLVWILPGLLTFWGMIQHFRLRGILPGDWYALSTLVLFLLLDQNQQVRYLLPVAPFLLSYFLFGLDMAANACARLAPEWRKTLLKMALVAWIITLITLNGFLLFRGNQAATHSGLCLLSSPSPEAFYKGDWLDLYQAGIFLSNIPKTESIVIQGGSDKYLMAFSGRRIAHSLPEQGGYLVGPSSIKISEAFPKFQNYKMCRQFGAFFVYHISAPISAPGSNDSASDTYSAF